MEKPNENDDKYQFIEDDCHLTDYCHYWEDVEKYINQLESEKEELIEDVLHFSEWMNLVCLRDNRHKWTYRGDNHSKKHSTKEMLEIWKLEVKKLKQ